MSDFWTAVKTTLKQPADIARFVLLSVGFFYLLVMVPVWTTPGNDFFFQISLFGTWVFILMIVLSIGNGLLLAMQRHIYKEKKEARSRSHDRTEKTTLLGSIVAAFLATIGCAACYSSILSVFGLGTVAFIVEYRFWIALLAVVLTFISLMYSVRRINHTCETCSIA